MTAITQTITSAPTPPSRTDPTTFADRSDAFVGYMEDVPVEYNALSSQVNVVASEITANANLALSQATIATNAALSASASANFASASANFQGNWTATTYTVPSSVFYNGSFWLANATTTSSDVPGISSKWTRYDRNESQFNTKSTSQALITTAAASGSTGIQIINDSNINFGTGDFSINIVLAVPDWTPAANVILAQKHDTTNGWILTLLTTGKLRLTINSTTYDSTTAITTSNGYFADIVVTIKRETASIDGAVTFYQDGRQLGESVVITAASPVTVDNTSVLYIVGTSATQIKTINKQFLLFNIELSINEIYYLYINGLPNYYQYGSNTPTYISDFSLSVDGWYAADATNMTITYNVDINADGAGTPPSNDWLKITRINTVGRIDITKELGVLLQNNKRQAVSCTIHNPVGSVFTKFGIEKSGTVGIDSVDIPAGTTKTILFEIFPQTESSIITNQRLYIGPRQESGQSEISAPINSVYYIKDVKLYSIGSTIHLESNNLQQKQWLDSSINKLHAMLPAAGTALKLNKNSFEIRWVNTWAGTHEAQYIGGFNQAILPVGCYIESIIGVITGTTIEDIIIGDGSDTDRWVAATTGLAAGTVSFTIANRISHGTNYKMIVDPDNAANMSISWIIKGIIL